jgi:hypothetical protein
MLIQRVECEVTFAWLEMAQLASRSLSGRAVMFAYTPLRSGSGDSLREKQS